MDRTKELVKRWVSATQFKYVKKEKKMSNNQDTILLETNAENLVGTLEDTITAMVDTESLLVNLPNRPERLFESVINLIPQLEALKNQIEPQYNKEKKQ